MKYFFLISFFLLTGSFAGNAQDTLLLLTGRTKIVRVHEINTRMLYLSYSGVDHGKTKLRGMDLRDVFSVCYRDSARVITYVQDSAAGLDLVEDQMRSYISGEQYAAKHHKAALCWAGGAVTGLAGPYFIGSFYGLLVPAAYTGVSGVIPAGTRKLAKKNPELYADPYFVEGYKSKARKKNVMGALCGSLIGIGVFGITTSVLLLAD